jgi:hypothetical protein
MSDSVSTALDNGAPDGNAAPDPVLSVADIQNAIRVIDYAAEQGAFKGWGTIEQVLAVRNRMNEFLKAVAPPDSADTTVPATQVESDSAIAA